MEGFAIFCIARKLVRIHKDDRGWRKSSFSNIFKEKRMTKEKLESLQVVILLWIIKMRKRNVIPSGKCGWNGRKYLEAMIFYKFASKRKKRNTINLSVNSNG